MFEVSISGAKIGEFFLRKMKKIILREMRLNPQNEIEHLTFFKLYSTESTESIEFVEDLLVIVISITTKNSVLQIL